MMYFIICAVVALLLTFDYWDEGTTIYKPDLLLIVFLSVFPIINIICGIMAVFRILLRNIPDVILKGRNRNVK